MKEREIEIEREVLGDERVSDRERSVNKKREGVREKEKRERISKIYGEREVEGGIKESIERASEVD